MAKDAVGVIDLLHTRAAQDPDGVFARHHGEPVTFAALRRQAASLAAALHARGLEPGDRVAVMMRNSLEVLAVIFGLGMAGLVWVPLNVQQRGAGLGYILGHSAATLVIADADLLPVVAGCGADVGPERIIVNGTIDGHQPLAPLLAGAAGPSLPSPAAPAPAAIMYTSGTTGRPKGVILSHRMMRYACDAVGLVAAAGPGDVMLVWEPLYHIGGAQLLGLPMTRGVVLAMVDRFSASRFWDEARACGATHIHYLGGILQILLKQPPGPLDRMHGVRIAWGGGCPAEVWGAVEERFGVEIRECYGMTEASSITTYNDRGIVGSVGKPVPWFSVELRAADGRPVPPGGRGEIVVHPRAPGALSPGYLDDSEATARALRNGALHTGDLGSFDRDGNLVFHGRMTDSVRCRGENVSAWEVEHVAADHPAIDDCAMIGVAAEIGEQDIKLFVKPKDGISLDPAEISAWLGARLAPYQNPRYIALVGEFERTPSQRIMKHTLSRRRDDCFDRLSRQGG